MIDKKEFEKADYSEKVRFVKKILSLATHNAFTKDDLLFLLKWQFEQNEQLKEKIKILEVKNFEKCPFRYSDIGCDYCDWRDRDLKEEVKE